MDTLLAGVIGRTGADLAHNSTPEGAAEFFAAARVDLTADEALAARGFRPDLAGRELYDYIGPLVAGAHHASLATLPFAPGRPPRGAC